MWNGTQRYKQGGCEPCLDSRHKLTWRGVPVAPPAVLAAAPSCAWAALCAIAPALQLKLATIECVEAAAAASRVPVVVILRTQRRRDLNTHRFRFAYVGDYRRMLHLTGDEPSNCLSAHPNEPIAGFCWNKVTSVLRQSRLGQRLYEIQSQRTHLRGDPRGVLAALGDIQGVRKVGVWAALGWMDPSAAAATDGWQGGCAGAPHTSSSISSIASATS